jgi:hypothetical protein
MTGASLATWRRFSWVAWRQHRTGLIVVLGLFALPTVIMAAAELDVTAHAAVVDSLARSSASADAWQLTLLGGWLELLPVMAGLLLGAPLLAQETESGSASFTWTQGIGRGSSLAGKAILVAAGLWLTAAVVSLEFGWWSRLVPAVAQYGDAPQFAYYPLSYAGWTVFGFSLGVLAGAIARRTVPALAGTVAAYGVLFYLGGFSRLPGINLTSFHTRIPFRGGLLVLRMVYPAEFREFAALILASCLLVAAAGLLITRRSA